MIREFLLFLRYAKKVPIKLLIFIFVNINANCIGARRDLKGTRVGAFANFVYNTCLYSRL